MKKKFITHYSLLITLTAIFALSPLISFAQSEGKFRPQVTIPGSEFKAGDEVPITNTSPDADDKGDRVVSATLLAKYIKAVYQYGVWAVIVLAIFMMMVGGFMWLIAGGSSERVSTAKSYISHALVGLVLALFSYTILYILKPRTVNLETLNINAIGAKSIGSNYLCCVTPENLIIPFQSNVSTCKQVNENWQECQSLGYQGKSCYCSTINKAGLLPEGEHGCFETTREEVLTPSELQNDARFQYALPPQPKIYNVSDPEGCNQVKQIIEQRTNYVDVSCQYQIVSCKAFVEFWRGRKPIGINHLTEK